MTTRRTFSPLDSSPLFIVSFRLEALPEIGNPPIVTLHDLYQWFPEGNIEYVDIPFNLDDKGGQALFERRIERFVKKYKSKFKQFVIFEYFTILLKLIVWKFQKVHCIPLDPQ